MKIELNNIFNLLAVAGILAFAGCKTVPDQNEVFEHNTRPTKGRKPVHTEVEGSKAKIQGLQEENAELKRKIEELENKNTSLSEDIRELTRKISELATRLRALSGKEKHPRPAVPAVPAGQAKDMQAKLDALLSRVPNLGKQATEAAKEGEILKDFVQKLPPEKP